ncbi:AAA family ATPase [Motilibacter aurantiacus]|uniref:AAA family ATPase n=1 Tax=Motilibacter aurantiacus TaxID=2714955 RepID=UPI0038B31D11
MSSSVFDVFTPTTPARLNFVHRERVNDKLVDALRTPGKQVVIYGESGSGKSTLLQRKLEQLYPDHVTTRCSFATTYEAAILDAFDQLNRHYVESTTTTRGRGSKGTLRADF